MKILKEHQKKVVDFISKDKNRGILLIHDTGTGKTLTSIASIFEIQKTKNKDVTIITPVTLTEKWKNEIIEFNGFIPENFKFQTFQSVFKYNIEEYFLDNIIVIDEVHNLRTEIGSFYFNSEGIIKFALEHNIKNFPIEEFEGVHKINKELTEILKLHKIPEYLITVPKKGKYAYYIMICALNAFKIILLTATPIINSYRDLDNIFKMFNNNIQNMSTIHELDFIMSKYKIPVSYYFIEKTPENGYPYYNIYKILVEMDEQQKKLYENFEKNIKLNLTEMNKLRVKVNTEIALEYYSPKIKHIIEHLEKKYLKTLIYSFFIDKGMEPVYNMLIEKSNLKKEEIFMITGKTKIDHRQTIVDQFNNIEKGVMIISSAGREGIDLKGVRYVFLLEPGWNESSDHQALSRAVRFGSHKHLPLKEQKVDIFRLILKGTIDFYLYEKFVKTKKAKSDKFMRLCQKYTI